jgi:isoamylase
VQLSQTPISGVNPVIDNNFYIIFNAHHESLNFTLPGTKWGKQWLKEIETTFKQIEKAESFKAGDKLIVEGRSLVILRHAS